MNKHKNRLFGIVLPAVLLLCFLFAFGACKSQEPEKEEETEPNWVEIYSGTYYVDSAVVDLLGHGTVKLNVGDSFLINLIFKKESVTLTLSKDGSMTFHANIFDLLTFDLTGTWDIDEKDVTKVNLRIEGEPIPHHDLQRRSYFGVISRQLL